MCLRLLTLIIAALLGVTPSTSAGAAERAASERLVVVELFTSRACPACPPAEALTAEMARTDAALLPLDLHVAYWNRPGRVDPHSLPTAGERQERYAAQFGGPVYTPQAVIAGRHVAVGSDAGAVRAAVARARRDASEAVSLGLAVDGGTLRVQVGAGRNEAALWLVGFDRLAGGGNVARAITPAGTWHGAPLALTLPRPPGERAAVLLQAADGRILAATATP